MKKEWVVVQDLKTKSPAVLKEYAEEIVAMVGSSPYFNMPNPTPSNPGLPQITIDIGILDAAISAPGGGPTKTDAIREATYTVQNDLNQLGRYVATIANMLINKTIGDVIIHAAGMDFRKTGVPKARVFAVVNNPAQQGSVIARTENAGNRSIYEWQFKKANEVNYAVSKKSVKASYTYPALQAGNRYHFRVEVTDSKGNTNMSNVLELVVL